MVSIDRDRLVLSTDNFKLIQMMMEKIMKVNGLEISFDNIMKKHYGMVYHLAYTQLNNSHNADDICQEVFMSLYGYDKVFNSEEHLKAWLLRVAINRCRKIWNNKWYKYVVCTDNIDIYESHDRYKSEIEYAVKELPKKYRMLIHLYYYEDLSIKEIADIVHQKESTIASALDRARKILRSKLKEDYDFE